MDKPPVKNKQCIDSILFPAHEQLCVLVFIDAESKISNHILILSNQD